MLFLKFNHISGKDETNTMALAYTPFTPFFMAKVKGAAFALMSVLNNSSKEASVSFTGKSSMNSNHVCIAVPLVHQACMLSQLLHTKSSKEHIVSCKNLSVVRWIDRLYVGPDTVSMFRNSLWSSCCIIFFLGHPPTFKKKKLYTFS